MKGSDNTCICCGCLIPEGRQICPKCSSEGDCFEQVMSRPVPAQPEFKVDDAVEQVFRQGYTTGFEEAMKTACGLKQENARLQRENDYLRSTIQRHSSEEVEYE